MKLFVSSLLWQAVKIFVAIGYSSFFSYAVFFARRRRGLAERFVNPVPLVGSVKNFLNLDYERNSEAIAFFSNLFGNIALFLPLPFLLIHFLRIKTLSNVLLASFILSLSVEAIQFLLKRGVADADDVLLNTLGAWAGYRLYAILFGNPSLAKA